MLSFGAQRRWLLRNCLKVRAPMTVVNAERQNAFLILAHLQQSG